MLGGGLIVVIEIEEKAELLNRAKAIPPLHLALDCQTLGRGVKVLCVAVELLLKLHELPISFSTDKGCRCQLCAIFTDDPVELKVRFHVCATYLSDKPLEVL